MGAETKLPSVQLIVPSLARKMTQTKNVYQIVVVRILAAGLAEIRAAPSVKPGMAAVETTGGLHPTVPLIPKFR
ncbi:hypothetical protein A2197_01870 [Candidatus Woesebacteria bacterium RIFOXYA1_FULL_48_16]|uniref:Uncharacterized protein n=1 Tax=Candidatus Woesebacteria bacterium RIFOXYA1_FULL_48_16 TaxID=1802535 RepID=A0A1F8CLW7_9BACT|nr:MAG: hypothetical protein A2197_01870 [Candidatus Woesebacteria bacterium RIFOXYA1_FULL_48_16]